MIIFTADKYGLENTAWICELNAGFLTPRLSRVATLSGS